MKKVFLVLVVIVVAFSCKHYSSGERIGIPYKLSEKGFVFKTWEGEVNLGGMRSNGDGGAVVNTFEFSIDKQSQQQKMATDSIIATLNTAFNEGKRVKIKYHQEFFTNCACQRGETNYFVDSVELLQN